MGTLYAVSCENTENRNYFGLCGLFKSKEKADAACDFWNKGGNPNYKYSVSYITTDIGD